MRPNDVVTSDLEGIRAEKDANISKRKKVDAELKQLNLNIQKLVSKQETHACTHNKVWRDNQIQIKI